MAPDLVLDRQKFVKISALNVDVQQKTKMVLIFFCKRSVKNDLFKKISLQKKIFTYYGGPQVLVGKVYGGCLKKFKNAGVACF